VTAYNNSLYNFYRYSDSEIAEVLLLIAGV